MGAASGRRDEGMAGGLTDPGPKKFVLQVEKTQVPIISSRIKSEKTKTKSHRGLLHQRMLFY